MCAEYSKYLCVMKTPVGMLTIEDDGLGITAVSFCDDEEIPPHTILQKQAVKELKEYFAGKRKEFDLPLTMSGTEFQLDDWNALCTIPYGYTYSYGDIAEQLGHPKAYRAVGSANHANPIAIIVPCHRVVGSDGKIRGYGGGQEKQAYLLALERKYSGKNNGK